MKKRNQAISVSRDGRQGRETSRGQHRTRLPGVRGERTCYRYSPLLSDENELIADLLVGLTDLRKMWGSGQCFLHLRNVKDHSWNQKASIASTEPAE